MSKSLIESIMQQDSIKKVLDYCNDLEKKVDDHHMAYVSWKKAGKIPPAPADPIDELNRLIVGRKPDGSLDPEAHRQRVEKWGKTGLLNGLGEGEARLIASMIEATVLITILSHQSKTAEHFEILLPAFIPAIRQVYDDTRNVFEYETVKSAFAIITELEKE
jgi:hypothetical protein